MHTAHHMTETSKQTDKWSNAGRIRPVLRLIKNGDNQCTSGRITLPSKAPSKYCTRKHKLLLERLTQIYFKDNYYYYKT